jgi:uncharacterized protein (DUF736 family)
MPRISPGPFSIALPASRHQSLSALPDSPDGWNPPNWKWPAAPARPRTYVGPGWSQIAKSSGETYLNLKIASPEFGNSAELGCAFAS